MDRQFTKQGNHISRCRRGEVDPLSLDSILMETARLSERGEMYFRFLRRRLATDLESVAKGDALKKELRDRVRKIGTFSEILYWRQFLINIGIFTNFDEIFKKKMANNF